ncbi:MAG: hypothetical protein ACXADY_17075 [Candidatus Hodarchaeales archaeon]|jgi:hypothetical protein
MGIFDRDKFGVQQRHRRLLSAQEAYHIKDVDTDQDLLWIKRDRFGRKTHMHVFPGDPKTTPEIMTIKDNAWFDSWANFDIIDNETNQNLGRAKRNFFSSILRENWTIWDGSGKVIGKVKARSLPISLFRNLRWILPFGWILGLIAWMIRLQFDIYLIQNGEEVKVGEFNRRRTIGDKYILDMTADSERRFNRKFAVALAVLLDSAEQR